MGSSFSTIAGYIIGSICSNADGVYPPISCNTSAVCILAITGALGTATMESPHRANDSACVVMGISYMVIRRGILFPITERRFDARIDGSIYSDTVFPVPNSLMELACSVQ